MAETNKLAGLKIACIGQASLNDTHGGATRLKTMISIFNNLGIYVDLVTYSFYSDKFCVESKSINNLLQSTTICVPNILPKCLKAFAIFPLFFYAFRSTRCSDLVFSNFRAILSSFPAVLLGNIFNKPVVLDYLDIDKHVPEPLYKFISKNSEAVFSITHQLEDKAIGYGCLNSIYLPNFVNTSLFKMDPITRTKIRDRLKIDADTIIIGYAGSFAIWEGVPILISAFKSILKKYPYVKLAIMGWMRYKNICDDVPKIIEEMDLKDSVILIPPQRYEDVPTYLSAFDILCCPKIDMEINRLIVPIKIIEYMSMGLPTVSSAIGGIPEIIENNVNGFLVTPGDIKELENKLEWIILNFEFSKKIGITGRICIEEKYSYDAIEATVIGSIDKLLNSNLHC